MVDQTAFQLGQVAGALLVSVLALGVFAFFIFSIVKAATRPAGKKTAWVVSAVISGMIAGLALLGLGGTVIARLAAQSSERSALKAVSAPDKSFTIKAPGTWSVQKDLVPEAQLQLANLWAEQYFVVITESKLMLGIPLDEVDQLTMEQIATDNGIKPTPAKALTVNDLPARQHRYETKLGIIKVSHVRTVIETQKNFHYVNAWTLTTKAKSTMPLFDQVISSFRAADGPPVPEVEPEMIPVVDPEKRVLRLLQDQLGLEPSEVQPSRKLTDLGTDELDSVEIIMALEEAFGLSIEDEAADKFQTVGDIVSYVKANARIPANLPEIPGNFPSNTLLQPRFHGGSGEEFEAGSAFLCETAPGNVLLLTAQHLFGPAGGLEKDLAWDAMAQHYPKASATISSSAEPAVENATLISLPGAAGMTETSSASDLAAYRIDGKPKVPILRLASKDAAVGDIVFLDSGYVGWTPAEVIQVDADNLFYRFFVPNTQLRGTSGGPVVNQAGEVVALNVGGREGKVTIGIGNPCTSMRKLLEKGKK